MSTEVAVKAELGSEFANDQHLSFESKEDEDSNKDDATIPNENTGVNHVNIENKENAGEKAEVFTPESLKPDECSDSTTELNTISITPENSTTATIEKTKVINISTSMSSSVAPEIQKLPLDSLHTIASFLTPDEWCNGLGLVNKTMHSHCREIVRRVRMHAFKCATEVVSAWKLGQNEDAHELAALYCSAGVPLYSRCLGHSYHTLHWRMKVEAKESGVTDPFYGTARTEFRAAAGYGREITYLEEKCLCAVGQTNVIEANTPPRVGMLRSKLFDPSVLDFHNDAKVCVPIHQHLLDQHRLGEYFVNDKDGRMVTPPISLSAEFFHPSSGRGKSKEKRKSGDKTDDSILLDSDEWPVINEEGPHPQDDDDDDLELFAPPSPALTSILNRVNLEVYTSSSTQRKTDTLTDSLEVRRHMRSRFATYHRRLETFIAKGDPAGFDECMLDFWDEFFPHTAGIHYHDMETAVPRISQLQKFLTRPCPKAIGVVQCEIERIKVSSKGKGVNMKGRLFPTYEYRLFIRNRPHNAVGDSPESASTAEPEGFVRRDTVLMVAKHRGRKHAEITGVVPMSAASKKGSNNYYLYLPQQMDVDSHFNKVNENAEHPAMIVSNGASFNPVLVADDSSSILLGRLQSNFIGTDFQIFTPHLRKIPRRPKPEFSASQSICSEDESGYDSGFSSDNTSIRRSRFGRLSRRRHGHQNNPLFSDASSLSGHEILTVKERPSVQRALSSPDMIGRQGRGNRRAIANDIQQPSSPQSTLWEEEDGAIMYTANLLGSRPRIMDVCIPKVSPGGIPGEEWKRYLANCDDTDDYRMISCFRQVLQRRDFHEQTPNAEDDESESDDTDFGLMALQNRPPWWNVELGSFVLNFGGRVSVASVKNFQLCERSNHERVMLQFGRIKGRHSFTMDFQHPLTAVQAFSIAISSLQSKISFG